MSNERSSYATLMLLYIAMDVQNLDNCFFLHIIIGYFDLDNSLIQYAKIKKSKMLTSLW
jgi:hypothetical protein